MQQLLFAFLFCLQLPLLAQESSDVLLTINDEAITVDEFTRVYEKNLNLVEDEEHRDPKAYLDLFVDYKLKVQEAYHLGLDKKPTYQKELTNYRKQLVKSHLTNINVTEELVKEAYDRTKEERRGQHILVRVTPTAAPKDTLIAYTKISTARARIVAGEDFANVAKEASEDPSAQKNGGDLGYFKAFKMVYPFESAAYNTRVGEVSQPFRTRFGYHIVQPTNSRVSKGTVTVAHIMVSSRQADSAVNAEQRIQEVYTKLNAGTPFETLVKNYSDDKNSATKGGELNPIEEGQLSTPIFEEKAFAISDVGTYTAPFKTKFGWHIVKLLGKEPIGSYDNIKKSLQQRIIRDARAQVIDDNLIEELRNRYGVSHTNEIEDYFKSTIPEDYNTATIDTSANVMDKVALKVGGRMVTYRDFGKHLTGRVKTINYPSRDAFVEDQVLKFTNKILRSYHEEHLEDIDPEFKAVLREYTEGLLLFDLLESQIWEKAKTDSLGLKHFFEKNKSQFKSEAQVDAVIVTAPNAQFTKKAKKYLKKEDALDEIQEKLSKESNEYIVVSKKINISDLPNQVKKSKGSLSIIANGDITVIYKILEYNPSQIRSLDKVRGLVTSSYQKEIEDNFVSSIRKKSSIDVNETVLKALEIKYND